MVTNPEKKHVILTWIDFVKFLVYAWLIGVISGAVFLAIGAWTNWYYLLAIAMFNVFVVNYWFVTFPSFALIVLIAYWSRKKKKVVQLN